MRAAILPAPTTRRTSSGAGLWRQRTAAALLLVAAAACAEPPAASPPPTSPAAPTEPSSGPPVELALDGCVATVTELPASTLYDPADPRLHDAALLVAHKSARRLMLFGDGTLQACLRMGLGFDPQGHKQLEGDGRTPEGWYRTSDKPWSDFPGAIAIHYPNEHDATLAAVDGRLPPPLVDEVLQSLALDQVPPQQTPLGGEVLIHGGGSERDWTLGCMALADEDLERLRAALPEDQRVSLLVLP